MRSSLEQVKVSIQMPYEMNPAQASLTFAEIGNPLLNDVLVLISFFPLPTVRVYVITLKLPFPGHLSYPSIHTSFLPTTFPLQTSLPHRHLHL